MSLIWLLPPIRNESSCMNILVFQYSPKISLKASCDRRHRRRHTRFCGKRASVTSERIAASSRSRPDRGTSRFSVLRQLSMHARLSARPFLEDASLREDVDVLSSDTNACHRFCASVVAVLPRFSESITPLIHVCVVEISKTYANKETPIGND